MYFGVEASVGSFFFLYLVIAREESEDTDYKSLPSRLPRRESVQVTRSQQIFGLGNMITKKFFSREKHRRFQSPVHFLIRDDNILLFARWRNSVLRHRKRFGNEFPELRMYIPTIKSETESISILSVTRNCIPLSLFLSFSCGMASSPRKRTLKEIVIYEGRTNRITRICASFHNVFI